jgi:hypothetical protein
MAISGSRARSVSPVLMNPSAVPFSPCATESLLRVTCFSIVRHTRKRCRAQKLLYSGVEFDIPNGVPAFHPELTPEIQGRSTQKFVKTDSDTSGSCIGMGRQGAMD